jgi:hypothetical protein
MYIDEQTQSDIEALFGDGHSVVRIIANAIRLRRIDRAKQRAQRRYLIEKGYQL